MITLITGLPGNGKTLHALWLIKAYAAKEGREVYYSGIKDLLLPWTEVKPEDWHTLPAGAIIVIDECQFIFPKKPNGSQLPAHYEKLAVHRHNGHDLFLITQNPALVDQFVRKLCGRHLHLIRKFGMQRANVWEWAAVNDQPEKPASHKSAVGSMWAYPKEVFSYYKSAELHTHKRRIPPKLIFACLFVVAIAFIGYYALARFQARSRPAVAPVPAGAHPAAGASSSVGRAVPFDAMADAREYVAQATPRVVGLPHTAPKYDDLTAPVRVPVPAACIQVADRCKCLTQQGTPMGVPHGMCVEFARNGWFQDFDPDADRKESEKTRESVAILEGRGEVPGASSSQVVVFGNPGPDRPHVPAVGGGAGTASVGGHKGQGGI